MKHTIIRAASALALATVLALTAVACGGKDDAEPRINIDTQQLLGKWVEQGTQTYWRYRSDHTGVTWDEAEDIAEEESNLTFEWKVGSGELTHVFTGEMGNQAVPKTYGIISFGSSRMVWQDDYGQKTTLVKQQ